MKKILMLLAFVMMVSSSSAQVDAVTSIGWRNGVINSYCEEYDVMLDDGKQWILPWNASRELIKYALLSDGFSIEETDSTISWKNGSIIKYEILFDKDSEIKSVGTIIIVKPINGIEISDALKRKLESIYGEKGKIKSVEGTAISYTWYNSRCSKGVVSFLYKKMIDKDTYLITQYSSQLH